MADADDVEALPTEGVTLVEVHMRMYLDADGLIDHTTNVTGHSQDDDLPPEYAVLGAWEMAKDTIKSYYEDGWCDDPDCEECGDD